MKFSISELDMLVRFGVPMEQILQADRLGLANERIAKLEKEVRQLKRELAKVQKT